MCISTNYVSDAQANQFGNPKCYNCKDLGEKPPRTECREIDPNPKKDRAMHEGEYQSL
jgi:hypothetical protein